VREALASLPWVDDDSNRADRITHKVRFGIYDKSKFDLDQIREALPPRFREGVELVSGPE
jgi:hypothetical protein